MVGFACSLPLTVAHPRIGQRHSAAVSTRRGCSKARRTTMVQPAATGSPPAAAPLQRLEDSAEAVAALATANPGYAAALATQQAVLSTVCDALGLEEVCSTATGPCGGFSAASHDGSSGAAVRAYRGGGVNWLSCSALANRAAGMGTTRLLGFVEGDRDTPHYALEHVFMGERVQAIITLWPRQNVVTDLAYLDKYFNTAAGEHTRSYNCIANGMIATAEQSADWRHYTSPVAAVKPLLATSISYTFPTEQGNMDAFRAAALEVARLWVSFLQAPPSPARNAAECHALDARYFSAIISDPANIIAVRLFGEEATNKLLKMATGHPAVAT